MSAPNDTPMDRAPERQDLDWEGFVAVPAEGEPLTLRPAVLAFAQVMEWKLRQHDATRGESWRTSDVDYLMEHLSEEVEELRDARNRGTGIAEEAADVANMAMMVADRLGKLSPPNAPAAPSLGERGVDDETVAAALFGWNDWAKLSDPALRASLREGLLVNVKNGDARAICMRRALSAALLAPRARERETEDAKLLNFLLARGDCTVNGRRIHDIYQLAEAFAAPRARGEDAPAVETAVGKVRIEYGVRRKGETALLHEGPLNRSGLDTVLALALARLGTRYLRDREVVQRRVVTEPWTPATPPTVTGGAT